MHSDANQCRSPGGRTHCCRLTHSVKQVNVRDTEGSQGRREKEEGQEETVHARKEGGQLEPQPWLGPVRRAAQRSHNQMCLPLLQTTASAHRQELAGPRLQGQHPDAGLCGGQELPCSRWCPGVPIPMAHGQPDTPGAGGGQETAVRNGCTWCGFSLAFWL